MRIFQSPFGCSALADLLTGSYTDPADAGSLSEELDAFPVLQLDNPQGVPTADDSAQARQTVHHQQPPPPPPSAAPLPEDVQADSVRYSSFFSSRASPLSDTSTGLPRLLRGQFVGDCTFRRAS